MAASKEQAKIILVGFITIFWGSILTDGDKIGVNYGTVGSDLPPADEVVSLMKKHNIGKARIFKANTDALKALANSGIEVIVGVGSEELQAISSKQESADAWVNDNIVAFYPATNIKYIAVGNLVLCGAPEYIPYLLPAMTNIQTALQNANLQNNIKVSTTHNMSVIAGIDFPVSKGALGENVKDTAMRSLLNFLIAHNSAPSQGTFSDDVKDTMRSILEFLSYHGSPFMANVYPYFMFTRSSGSVSLDYALFKPTTPLLDGVRRYTNLFDAVVDTIISAMENLGYPDVPLIVTESGWPSFGEDVATVENAQAYNNNLIKHVLSNAGTPKRPGTSIETYMFALFRENLKPGPTTEHDFGLFNRDQTPAYAVNFSP